ncbi:MAG TPA: sigma-70 family RNA polymerase sigma factor [Steroidobacteraceae bacterium]|nr:sigma-70 family RNA polymerase sigma factor [Steroidobacteraceae bacterium]
MAGSVPVVSRATALAPPDREAEARAWLGALRAPGPEREEAARRLHALLLRAARFELSRRRAMLAGSARETIEDLAMQSADDALSAILTKLDDYRFESRFTTWAYKFAILEAAVRTRRRAWQERELPIDPDAWTRLPARTLDPAEAVEHRERLQAIIEAVRTELSPHQREVLGALVLAEVPIDVLAERLGTTRGALYKTLHDARRKLRAVTGADS